MKSENADKRGYNRSARIAADRPFAKLTPRESPTAKQPAIPPYGTGGSTAIRADPFNPR